MLRRAWLIALMILAAVIGAELAMGRNPISTCGSIGLWVSARDSPRTSQMLADWYSFSHIVHGLIFYGALWLFDRRVDIDWRFLAALLVEANWEVIENAPMVIDRYRTATAALGYTGDSVINSLSDILMMALGFLLARKPPVRASIVALVALKFVPLFVIRDNLTLNIIALVSPSHAIQAWQAGG